MTALPDKFNPTIDQASAHLLARAENARGLGLEELRPRIAASVQKYLLPEGRTAEHADIIQFVEEMRADDLCLIISCEKGDEGSWSDMVAAFDATVRSAARKIASNEEDAEDLTSSIWAELYGLRTDSDGNRKSKLAYYSGRGSLAGWLRAVVSQLAIDQYRQRSKLVQVEEDREFENLANKASERSGNGIQGHLANPEDIYSSDSTAGELSAALVAAIASLAAEDRLIVKLYYFDQIKLKDIGATFGYHEATASRKLARVQTEIRKGVEASLKKDHGWTDAEVKRHLSDAAAGLGVDIERMFAVIAVTILMQEFWTRGVL
jgi:RNA polymerase sigma-70 factor